MPYYNRDPKRDHNFDNHPSCVVTKVRKVGLGFLRGDPKPGHGHVVLWGVSLTQTLHLNKGLDYRPCMAAAAHLNSFAMTEPSNNLVLYKTPRKYLNRKG